MAKLTLHTLLFGAGVAWCASSQQTDPLPVDTVKAKSAHKLSVVKGTGEWGEFGAVKKTSLQGVRDLEWEVPANMIAGLTAGQTAGREKHHAAGKKERPGIGHGWDSDEDHIQREDPMAGLFRGHHPHRGLHRLAIAITMVITVVVAFLLGRKSTMYYHKGGCHFVLRKPVAAEAMPVHAKPVEEDHVQQEMHNQA